MKALSILFLAMLVLTGCASMEMNEEDRFIWEGGQTNPPAIKP